MKITSQGREVFHKLFLFGAMLMIFTGAVSGIAQAHPALEAQVIQVTTTDDELNTDGDCSLREAIQAANKDIAVSGCPAGQGEDTVQLAAGTYKLTLAGANEDNNLTGDLDIRDADAGHGLTIRGAGLGRTILDGNAIDRVFHILDSNGTQITGMTIQNGSAVTGDSGGGGIKNNGDLFLAEVELKGNHAGNTGGGLDNFGSATLKSSTFTANTAIYGGGIYNSSSLSLEGVLLFNNVITNTSSYGGGFYNGGDAQLLNVTLNGNSAAFGGGLFNDSTLTVWNSTLADNSISVDNSGGGVIRFRNTIVANNSGNPNCSGLGTFNSIGHNLDSGNTCNFAQSTDLPNTPPQLGPLQDNQGPNWTRALLAGSKAIDAGDNVDCPATDQRGAIRPADGDHDPAKTKICDIGAFEVDGVFPRFLFLPAIQKK